MNDTRTPDVQGANVQKKKNSMVQRIITGLILVTALALFLWLGGWYFAAALCLCTVVALQEELAALTAGGHHPVRWTSYAGLIISAPLMMFYPSLTIAPVILLLGLCVLLQVMRRKEPELLDVLVSVMPMITVVLPAMCLMNVLDTQPHSLQLTLLIMVFGIAVGGDTFAYFVGSAVGGPKLCPSISPNKTIAGSLGGLAGSVLVAFAIGRIAAAAAPDAVMHTPVWGDLLVGLIGGCAAQIGDLFASMVKRHCKVKDFGTIFPGHGGMMDRLDSIFFTAIVVYCYRLILLA
ncbi:MAG: hypothetical protein E7319_01490 [Clostridiales bacterium]|nr:hypothetical protein [Clostridiales bacterium]